MTATSRTDTETGRGGTTTVTKEDETATGIAMMTGTAGTLTEVSCSPTRFSPFSLSRTCLFFTTFFLHFYNVASLNTLLPGFDSRGGGGGGRRAFGSGFRRDYDDSRGSGDRYGDRDRDRFGDRDRYGDHDRYGDREERREERGECSFYSLAWLINKSIWKL